MGSLWAGWTIDQVAMLDYGGGARVAGTRSSTGERDDAAGRA